MNSTWTFGDFLRKLYQIVSVPTGGTTSSSSSSSTSGVVSSGSGSSALNTARNISLTASIPRRNLDLYQISSRVNRSFFTSWDGPPPFTTLYIIPLILALGLVIALIWLWCACSYHTMKKIKSWCPSFKSSKKDNRREDDPEASFTLRNKEIPTPEILEKRRQERLSILQQECENLEQQLTDERNTTLTSRASDSDLEYLGAGEDSPPLKRNSISLQDIPSSVIRIRREKQLRQLKDEIERLHAISQQELNEVGSGSLRSPLLTDIKFEYYGSKSSKSSSPSPVDVSVVEPLSQHISHLKAQRKLTEIRAELEDLAIHLVHADELKAKTSSLQDLPRTALVAKRQANLLNISKEIENLKNYKLHQRDILSTVLPTPAKNTEVKNEILAKLNKDSGKSFKKQGNPSPSKSPLLKRQESEMSEASSTKTIDTAFAHSSSLKRTREQELNRVRVELKELSYKLNLNYSFDNDRDREKILPRDWPKQCSFSRENSYTK